MPEAELSLLFIRPLNRLQVRYLVSGSVAAILYGEPRLTHDVDFVVHLRVADLDHMIQVFPAPEFYVPPREVMIEEMQRQQGGSFNIIHADTGFKADLYLTGREDLHAWAFRNARRMDYCGEPVVVAPPEYVIVRKLEYYREGGSDKHVRDIRSMLAVSGEEIDRAALQDWIARRGLEEVWQRVAG